MAIRSSLLRGVRRFGTARGFLPSAGLFSRVDNTLHNKAIFQKMHCFSAESEKLLQLVHGEIHHENSNYESPATIKSFLDKKG